MKNINKPVLAIALIATLTFASMGSMISLKIAEDKNANIALGGTLVGGEAGFGVSVVFGVSALTWGAIALVPGFQAAGVVALVYGA